MRAASDIWWPRTGRRALLAGAALALAMFAGGSLSARSFSQWGPAVNAETLDGSHPDLNTAYVDGCPILSPYDDSLYMASSRPGGAGALDIWIAPRSGDGWGLPVNAGTPINSGAAEFCPSPARGNTFYFVRRLNATDTDIYVVKKLPTGWGTPQALPKGPGQINSDAEEWSPSWFEAPDGREFLYFSSTRNGPGHDIFYSEDFGPAQMVPGGPNSLGNIISDARPNVRRDGLEIVWDSTRAGGPPDIWTASRSSVDSTWGAAERLPVGVGQINSPAGESRPSFSWDGTVLMFGSGRASTQAGDADTDIYMSTRSKVTGAD